MFDYNKHILHAPDEALPTPVTTKEQYLYAKVTGGDTSNLPTPITTEEQYLYALAQSGGGGDGGGGGNVLTLYGRMEEDSLVVYIDPEYTTEMFDTYQEAADAVMGADIIKLVYDEEEKSGTLHHCCFANEIQCYENIEVTVLFSGVNQGFTLWEEELIPDIDIN